MLIQLINPQPLFSLCSSSNREHLSSRSVTQSEQNSEPLLVGAEFERRKIISVPSRLLPQAAVDHLKLNSEVLTILSERPT